MKQGLVLVCSFLIVFSTVFACFLLFQSSSVEESVNLKRHLGKTTEKQKLVEVLPLLPQEEKCQFSFGFLEDMLEKDRERPEKRRLLPGHRRQNFSGGLVNQDFMCLDTMDATENMWVSVFECHGNGRNQAITFTTDGLIEAAASRPYCLSIKNMVSTQVVLKKCDKNDGTQVWTTDSFHGHVMPNIRKDYCLNVPNQNDVIVDIQPCVTESARQKWQLIMNDVLLLLLDGVVNDANAIKKKNTKKQMEKLILQNRPIVSEDDTLIF